MTVRRLRSFSSRVRLALWSVVALGIAMTAVAFYAYWSQNIITLRAKELRRQVSIIAAGVAVSDIVPGSERDTDQTRARLLRIESGIINARLAVVDETGAVLFSTGSSPALPSYPVGRLAKGSDDFDPRSGVETIEGVGRVLLVAAPVSFSEPGQPNRYLLGARTLSDIGAADEWVLGAIAVAALASLMLAWIVGSVLSRRVTEPLRRLTKGARDIAEGRWGRQVAIEGDDETAELARAFNEMSSRTADTYRAQQAFVSDVSHEIRTPVTSISGFANAIADGTLRDHDAIVRAAGIIAQEAAHMAGLTSALLSLADLEAGAVPIAAETVDVEHIATQLRDRFALPASDVGVQLDIDLGAARPLADTERLLQALSALVENALKYADSRVEVASTLDGDRWLATVEDDGPGVPEEDRQRVFGRFTRLDQSRSSTGSGLGLSICRRLVEIMGGEVEVDTSPGHGGARFTVKLPAAHADTPSVSTRTQHAANSDATLAAESTQ